MKNEINDLNATLSKLRTEDLPGYPEYSEDDDIFFKGKAEKDIDPEDITMHKKVSRQVRLVPVDSGDAAMGSDLDVPGSELDDDLEDIGSEDEENNYYSMGEEHADDQEDLLE